MRNLLALTAMALLVFLGLGWYLNWYKIQSTPGTDGHRQISIDLDTQKIKEDVTKGRERVGEILRNDNKTPTPPAPTPALPGTTTNYPPNQDGSPFTFPAPSSGSPSLPIPK